MSLKAGREAYLGIGFETANHTASQPQKWLPFMTNTLHGAMEPLEDEAARGLRERVSGAIAGPKRGEGDVEILVDVENAPYLIVPVLGSAAAASASTTNAYVHVITRKASNDPKTITLNCNNGVDQRKYTYGTINTMELTVSDGLATITVGMLSKFPETGTGTKAITEETILGFKDYNIYFGDLYSTLKSQVLAGSATATKVSAFSVRINNNAEVQHLSGSNDVASVSVGQLEIEGDYTLFFENTTQRGYYEGVTKKALIVQFVGGAIDSDYEELFIGFPEIHLRERAVDTAIGGFLTENPTFVAEYDATQAKSIEIRITNTNNGSDWA